MIGYLYLLVQLRRVILYFLFCIIVDATCSHFAIFKLDPIFTLQRSFQRDDIFRSSRLDV